MTQPAAQFDHLPQIMLQDSFLVQPNRVARDVVRHVRIAVTVAADPPAKAQ